MSYTTSYYHVVFRTYRSEPTIPIKYERELYAYINGLAQQLNCKVLRIGGMPEHIHLFVSLPPDLPIASFVQQIKSDSSKWLKANPHFPRFFGWARGYAGISKSERDKSTVIRYIMRQKEHHLGISFPHEYHTLLERNGIAVDDRYFLRDD